MVNTPCFPRCNPADSLSLPAVQAFRKRHSAPQNTPTSLLIGVGRKSFLRCRTRTSISSLKARCYQLHQTQKFFHFAQSGLHGRLAPFGWESNPLHACRAVFYASALVEIGERGRSFTRRCLVLYIHHALNGLWTRGESNSRAKTGY